MELGEKALESQSKQELFQAHVSLSIGTFFLHLVCRKRKMPQIFLVSEGFRRIVQ